MPADKTPLRKLRLDTPVLLIDDEEAVLRLELAALTHAGLERIVTCSDSRRALELVRSEEPALVLLDLSMPHKGGEELLGEILGARPETGVLVVTGQTDLACAVRCMKHGAIDYLVKPIGAAALLEAVEAAITRVAVEHDLQRLRAESSRELRYPEAFADILTTDAAMLRMFRHVESIAKGSQPVFVAGETGTGKELVARALHACSGRMGRFVSVNVAGLDDAMFADVLFGHRAGAFTGAVGERHGMIEEAADGTLFLDEIGDLDPASQVKLLRVLQEKEYYPHGSDKPMPLRARIVTATHKDPATLRTDFYFRLRAYRIDLPPLRERLGDLPLLVEHLLRLAAKDLGKRKPAVPAELFVYLANHDYPGNVRELQSMVFDAMARHEQGVMRLDAFLEHLPARRGECRPTRESRADAGMLFPHALPTLREIQEAAVREAMERTQGNLSAAARLLGVSRPTVQRHLRREAELSGAVRGPSPQRRAGPARRAQRRAD